MEDINISTAAPSWHGEWYWPEIVVFSAARPSGKVGTG
jgi:hypothetical protein